jgi:transcriptional regulator with GAF, ATPase, and Fis domain
MRMAGGPFQLVVRRGDEAITHTFEQDVVTIGRAQVCDLQLDDRLVSRKHCRLERRDDGFALVDEGAQNRVRLRGVPVQRAEVRIGDRFAVGPFEVEIVQTTTAGTADETSLPESPQSAQDLAALIGIARALNEEHDLARLLTRIVDAAIELVGAERGFLILGSGPEATVEVARNFAKEEVLSPEFKISRTIAQRVRDSGVVELTTNAQEDDRFRALASVADLRLRSILCVPIRIRSEVVGVLYVDNRLQQQVFKERERALLTSLADHAGLAIHTARTLEQLRQQHVELEAAIERVAQLNASLKGQVAAQRVEISEMREELAAGRHGGRFRHDYGKIVGDSRRMHELFALLDKYIDVDDPVLILGESGTGKELVARVIHGQSRRRTGPFVSENCAALPESLLESELFGYSKGAFTGATQNKKGLLESAAGGVLFLDEIGEMPLDLQSKLLRVLQEGELRPLGSQQKVKLDFRLITATNKNLDELVREGDFREDLFYRLNVLPVRLPPLRERREDLPALVNRILGDLTRETKGPRFRVSPEAMQLLVAYRWPGNVRELQNEIRRGAILGDGVILAEHLSSTVRDPRPPVVPTPLPAEAGTTLPDQVAALETRAIEQAMQQSGGNKSRAAELLGLSRFALQRKLEKYGLEPGSAAAPAEGTGG